MKSKIKSQYDFNRYPNTFEKSNYKLFVKSYYQLKPNEVKYWRPNPF